jgi:uncharacterized protein YjdB
MRRVLLLLVVMALAIAARASNNFTLSAASGHPGDEVTVTASLSGDEAVSAVDITIPLTQYTAYVAGSAQLVSSRAQSHQVSAAYTDGALRILVYSLTSAPLEGSGELLTFQLSLGKEPADYALTPKVKLSDASGSALDVSATGAAVTVLSPKLQVVTSTIDFGRSAIRGTYTRTLTLHNAGNESLTVSGFKCSAAALTVWPTSGTIAAGRSETYTVTYCPTMRDSGIEERIRIESDAVNGAQKATVTAVPYSVNELHVSNAQGESDSEVTISLTMNNMEPIVSAQCSFQLPDALKYVEGSVAAGTRANGHSVNARYENGTLTLYLISLTNTPLNDADGELLNFRLKLDGQSGRYSLNPQKVVLSNASSENMTSDTHAGYVHIKAPRISCSSSVTMPAGAVTDGTQTTYTLSNDGSVPLTVSRIVFADDGYSVAEALPLTVPAGSAQTLTLQYSGSQAGEFSTTMHIYSNDPESRMTDVAVSGCLYEPNKLEFSGEPSDDYDSFVLHVDLTNYTDIVALQLDVHGLTGMTAGAEDLILSSRASGHSASIREISSGVHRVVIFSLSNMAFTGNSGRLFDLTFSGANCRDGQFTIDNIKLSNASGINYTSPDASVSVGLVNVVATAIFLDQTTASVVVNQTLQLAATVSPTNAADKTVMWTSSNEAVATVDANGLVTAHKVGNAIIKVATTDGSKLTATCALTITPQLVEEIELSETRLVLHVGDECALEVAISPSNTTNPSIVWSSSDSTIVRVEDGKITAVMGGTATIVATTADGSNVSASCAVEVLAPASGIDATVVDAQRNRHIYTIGGVLIQLNASQEDITRLAPGCYIIQGKTRIKQ